MPPWQLQLRQIPGMYGITVYRFNIEPIDTIKKFEVYKGSIIIQKGPESATFLPNAAAEQEWDKKTTVENLCKKAGLKLNAWKDSLNC